MTPADLEAFRARMGWNRRRLSKELDVSQDRLRRMLAGGRIPRHIALACAALAQGVPPIGEKLQLTDIVLVPEGWTPFINK